VKPVPKPADAGKWEVLRRLRYGDVLKLIRSRYGAVPPDDDAGRPDVMELLFLASMAPAGWEKKVRHAIELYAPWMSADEVESLIQHLSVTPPYQKLRTAEELGRILNLTNADRERLKLWRIKPVDMTGEELAEQSKARTRDRKAKARRANGVRTRAEYLAEIVKPKPWEDAGISRRQWQRRCLRVCPEMSWGEGQTIVTKQRTHLATSELGVSQEEGLQGSVATGRTVDTENSEQAERIEQGSSPALRTHPATPSGDLARVRAELEACGIEAWRGRHGKK
jgi:hypothetical protein